MKILIAVPCFDMVATDFMRSLVDLEKPEGTVYTVIKNTLIYNARNTIAANAVKMRFDRIMWFDSDVTFAPDTLVKLSKTMDNLNADIVTGLYFTRKTPTKPVVFDNLVYNVRDDGLVESGATFYEDYPRDTVVPVAGCGFGCVITSVDLINRLGQKYGAPFTPLFGLGEDLSFCYRATKEGASILLDSTVKCGHIGQVEFDEEVYERQKRDENKPQIVRCNDCKYCGSEIRDGIKFAKCELKHNWMPQADWFCADGEKDGDGE